MNIVKMLAGAFLLLMMGTSLQAQSKMDPASVTLSTVKEILDQANKLDKSDTIVKLEGVILEKIDEESFWFEDKTGKIRVEFEDDDIDIRKIQLNTRVTIMGEVDHDLLEGTEIEVEYFEVLSQ